jgi:hypothetical protein
LRATVTGGAAATGTNYTKDITITVYAEGTLIPISSREDFAKIGTDSPLDGNYVQTGDIDFSGVTTWTPIGSSLNVSTDTTHIFRGTFDGGGYSIINVNLTGMDYAGGFSFFGKAIGATFRNIHVTGTTITGSIAISGIAGEVSGASTFENCSNAVNLISTGGNAAGICTSVGTGSTITNSYNTGNITGASTQVGGIVGTGTTGSIIKNCYNTGIITTTGTLTTAVGGIAGAFGGAAAIMTACYNAGDIRATAGTTINIGGIVGNVSGNNNGGGAIIACYNKNPVSVTAASPTTVNAGGITGNNARGSDTVTASYNIGNVSVSNGTTKYIGGISGYNNYNSGDTITSPVITGCYWSGTGPTYGVGGVKDASTTTPSNTGAVQFASGVWPSTSVSSEWGTGDGSGSGKYWKSLGSSPSTSPKLWFES